MFRLILLVSLIVVTFCTGFLFAHEPFREVVIRKTLATFAKGDGAPQTAPNKPADRERKQEPESRQARNAPPSDAAPQGNLTESDRRQLDNLFEEISEDDAP